MMHQKYIFIGFFIMLSIVITSGSLLVLHYWLEAKAYPKSFYECLQLRSGIAKSNMSKSGRCHFDSKPTRFKRLIFCPSFRGFVGAMQCGDFPCPVQKYYCSMHFARQPVHGIGKLVVSSNPKIEQGVFLEVTQGENAGVHEVHGKRDVYLVPANSTIIFEAIFKRETFWTQRINPTTKVFERTYYPDLFIVDILGYEIVSKPQ